MAQFKLLIKCNVMSLTKVSYSLISGSPINVKDFGAVGDGITDDTAAFQAAVDAAEGKTLVTVSGASYRLGIINLRSNSEYQFGNSIFYPSTGTGDAWLFAVTGKTKVKIVGGVFSVASFTPVGTYTPVYSTVGTSWPNGYFYGGTSIYINSGSSFVEVSECRFEGQLMGVNIYNSTFCSVRNTTHFNGLAACAAVATTDGIAMYGIEFTDNTVIGSGDDAFVLLNYNTSGTTYIYACIVSRNYIDKTRLFASGTLSAVGIRTGYWATGGTGRVISCVISDNTMRNMVSGGMYVINTIDTVISGNTVQAYKNGPAYQFADSSLSAGANNGLVFSNNACTDPSGSVRAVDVNYVSASVFNANRLSGNSADSALGGVENRNNTFSGNTFLNAIGPAIRMSGASDYNVFDSNNFGNTSSPYLIYTGTYDVIGSNSNIPTLRQIDVAADGVIQLNCGLDEYVWVRCVSTVSTITFDSAAGPTYDGQQVVVTVRNQAVGALTVNWTASWKVASWGSLATGFTRSITFRWNNINNTWTEISRSSDTPN